MYDLSKGATRVKLVYDPLKVKTEIRKCAKYVQCAGQSAKSAAAAVAAAKLETDWLVRLTWQEINRCLQFPSLLE